MDEQQQQRVNQAAEEFTDALVQSMRAASEQGINVQEQNARLTEDFFNRTIENLRAQAEGTRQTGQQIAEQQQRQVEAAQALTQESVNAYMDLVNSMFNFGQRGAQEAERGAQEAPPRG
jgi:ABC-type hemin transport system substrate-binding protein